MPPTKGCPVLSRPKRCHRITSSVTVRNRRCGQSAHLIRGFSQMPRTHSFPHAGAYPDFPVRRLSKRRGYTSSRPRKSDRNSTTLVSGEDRQSTGSIQIMPTINGVKPAYAHTAPLWISAGRQCLPIPFGRRVQPGERCYRTSGPGTVYVLAVTCRNRSRIHQLNRWTMRLLSKQTAHQFCYAVREWGVPFGRWWPECVPMNLVIGG